MQEKKLGRGLSALIGENKSKEQLPIPSNQKMVEQISVKKIIAGIYQPRKNFNETDIAELADSIKANGIIQPIILRKVSDNDTYEIIAGERRFRAANVLGLSEVPAIVKKINNHEALEIALIENVQRSDLSLIEEAAGYQQLINEFAYSQEQIAKKIGKSRSHIANLLRLLGLPKSVQKLLEEKTISMGHARAIINSANPEMLAKRIISDSLTVRDIEDLVRDEKVEKVKSTPAFVRTESKVKFISSEYLFDLSKKLSHSIGMDVSVSYNSFKNSGKMTVKFDGFEKVEELLNKLEK